MYEEAEPQRGETICSGSHRNKWLSRLPALANRVALSHACSRVCSAALCLGPCSEGPSPVLWAFSCSHGNQQLNLEETFWKMNMVHLWRMRFFFNSKASLASGNLRTAIRQEPHLLLGGYKQHAHPICQLVTSSLISAHWAGHFTRDTLEGENWGQRLKISSTTHIQHPLNPGNTNTHTRAYRHMHNTHAVLAPSKHWSHECGS